MPFIKLQFRPGLNRDQTNYTNEGGWFACDKVRFRSGYPQKIGGWLASSVSTFLGVCRQMFGWSTSYNDNFLALGTNEKVYIEAGAQYYDITPLREVNATYITPATDNCITTSNGSDEVTVTITGCNPVLGNYIDISGAAAVGGISANALNKTHKIIQVVSGNALKIKVSETATSTATGGGAAITVLFEIDTGLPFATFGYGWGIGTWSSGVWGSSSGGTPIVLQQRDWWFDQFDNNLVMNIRNGSIYYWVRDATVSPTNSLNTRAVKLSSLVGASDVPDEAMQILVSQNDQHLLAFGATPFGGGDFDPLLIRWADQGNPQIWTPSSTNSAGDLRLSRGSEIVRALAVRQEILVWTNTNLYSLQFLGTTDVFGVQEYADNISIIGPRAVISANNVTYWMGQDKFYAYSGRVETLPCTIRNYVFNDINMGQTDQIICGTNEGYHEIWWFYPSQQSSVVDRYVIYNYMERIWYYGNMSRTAWLDNPLRQYPQAVGYDNILFDHERGVDANGAPMESYIQSADFDLSDGDNFMLSRRIIPDLNFDGSVTANPEVSFVVRPRNFPGSTYQQDSFDNQPVVETSVNVFTDQVFVRARARQMALKVQSTNLGVTWQLGSPRLDVRPDGKR